MTINGAARVERPAISVPVANLLSEAVRRFGTPLYAYDLDRLRMQVTRLQSAFSPEIDVLYSIKANPLPALCRLLASSGLGAEVASLGELHLAMAAGFPPQRTLINGPYKPPDLLATASATPELTISIDSISELTHLVGRGEPYQVMLRLRPDYNPACTIPMGPASRFGIPADELDDIARLLHGSALKVVGFHVYGGSQILQSDAVIANLRDAFELSLRAAKVTGIAPEVLDLGGGFGVPYGPHDLDELELESIGEELDRLAQRAGPTRLMLELGRYLIAPAGWYLTQVVAEQHYAGRVAVVVDGGTHHRPDLCGLDLATRSAPQPLHAPAGDQPGTRPTDVVGSLCLPWDVLAREVALPPLERGDVLIFGASGAYGISAAPHSFISHPRPAEVLFDQSGILNHVDTIPTPN